MRPKRDSVRLCARSRLKLTLLRLLRVQCGRGTGGARAAGYDYYGYDLVQNGVDALNAEECGFHCLTYACVRARALRASVCVRISCAVSQWSSTAGCAECALLSGSLGGAFAQPCALRRSLLVRFTGGGGCGYFTFKHDGTMLRCYLKPLFNLDGGYSEIGRCAPDQIGRYGRCVQPRVHPRDRASGAHVGRHPQFPESVPQVVLAQASR